MFVTATEFKRDPGRYLTLVESEDIVITSGGKHIARLTNPQAEKVALAKSLFGIIPADMTLEQIREERRQRYERAD